MENAKIEAAPDTSDQPVDPRLAPYNALFDSLSTREQIVQVTHLLSWFFGVKLTLRESVEPEGDANL